VTSDTKDLLAVVNTKARHIYEVSAPETGVSNDVNTEAHVCFLINEHFELPNKVTRCERLNRVTNTSIAEQMTDHRELHEEEEDDDDDHDDDDGDIDNDDAGDDDEMVYSDQSLDEDEHDC
jgi:hypothetical protein